MNAIRIVIEGVPVPWARPRFFTNRNTGQVHGFTPAKVQQNRDYIKKVAADAMSAQSTLFCDIALDLNILVVLPAPSSLKSAGKRILAAGGTLYVFKRPDADQYVKQLMDAFNGVVWKDDSQVARLSFVKVYGDKPRMEVTVTPLELAGDIAYDAKDLPLFKETGP